MALNESEIESFPTSTRPYKRADGGGLYVLVHPNGSRYWRLKYRFGGKEMLMALGVFPEVSIEEARKARRCAKDLLRKGVDPASVKRTRRLGRCPACGSPAPGGPGERGTQGEGAPTPA